MRIDIKPLRIKNKGILEQTGGFTLIEILIVVIVTGILTAISIPYAVNYINSEQALKTVKELKTLAQAENLFYQSNTTPLSCTVSVGGTNYPEDELYHIYTANFSDLINSGTLAKDVSGVNYFGQDFYFRPVYSNIIVNSNNYCVRSAGILVYTYIPIQYAGAVKSVSGAFDLGTSGNMEEVGYYDIPVESNPEMDATLKYNW